jgi:hypothetical protein
MTDERETPASATPEWRDQDGAADAAADRAYNPSVQQVNRSREQGLGVGQTEINAQRDPTRYNSAEQYGSGEGAARDLSPDAGGGPARPKTGSDSGESLDDSRDQFETGDQ